MLHLSPIGAAALIAREGRRLKAYRDSVGVWTIGVGHTSVAGAPKVTPGLTITSAECDATFARDVEKYAATVRAGLKVEVTQNQFDALVSICYNIGQGGFSKSSFLKRINAGAGPAAIKEAILMWGKPPEIISRREGEADQYLIPYTVRLPAPRRGDKPVRVAAPVLAVLAPDVPTPVIVPIAPPPLSAPPSWQPEWLVSLLGWLDARYAPAHDPNDVQDAHVA